MIRILSLALFTLALGACGPTEHDTRSREARVDDRQVIEVHWTRAAAEADERLSNEMLAQGKTGTGLPRLYVYDSRNRLIYVLDTAKAWNAATIGSQIDAAAKLGAPVEGPSFAQTVGEFELADGRPAATMIKGGNGLTVFDYWADWCVPCKQLEKGLRKWAAAKPKGSIVLVHAEADIMKLAKERGETIIMYKSGPGGKKPTKIINQS